MASVIKKVPGLCDIHDYRVSVNTPDFSPADWIINPNLANVQLPEISDITTTADVAGSLDGTYFLVNTQFTAYYVWMDVDNTSVDPAPGGFGIEVDISINDTANDVAAAIQTAVDAFADFTASVALNVVTITTSSATDATDAVDVDTGFGVTTTQQGINVPQIYWKVTGGTTVEEKTTGEKDTTDACLFTATIFVDELQDENSDFSGPISFIQDETRNFKSLSTTTYLLEFSKPTVGDQDWVSPQGRLDELAAYTCLYDATIVASATHVVDVGSSTYEFDVYINGIDSGVVGTIGGVGEQSATNVLINIDVSAGDLISMRATQTAGVGTMSEPITKLFLKWRLV